MVLIFQSQEAEWTIKMKETGAGALPYIERNASTALAVRLIPQYESHFRVTKEAIQVVVNLIQKIPHSNHLRNKEQQG